MQQKKFLNYLRDIPIALGIGFCFSAVISGILALIGIFAGMYRCLDLAQRIEFIVGALLLILFAIFIIASGKKPNISKVISTEKWVRVFHVLGFPEVFGLVGAGLILGGCFLDIWLVPMEIALYM